MRPATQRQKDKMRELGIEFDSDIELDEAAELIRDKDDRIIVGGVKLNENSLVENSDWED